jgi:hypothetical protein
LQIFVALRGGESSFKEDGELSESLAPVSRRAVPAFLEVSQGEVEKLGDGFVAREVASMVDELAQRGVERLNRVRRVDDASDVGWEVEEGNDTFPVGP